MAAYTEQKASDALTKFCSLERLRVLVKLYHWFNTEVVQFQVLSQWSDGFVTLQQEHISFEAEQSHQGTRGVVDTGRKQTSKVCKVPSFLSCSMLEKFSDDISNDSLPSLRDEWLELVISRFQRGRPPIVFAMFPECPTKTLDISLP